MNQSSQSEGGRLERLLRPRSLAVFGGAQAAAVVAQSRKMGFAGDIWPVHPTHAEVGGYPCFRSVAELPGAPDVAFVGVNRRLTIDVVCELAARGAGGAVCFASGFREAQSEDEDAAGLEDALLAAAGAMPILGPNCYGLINYLDGALLWPDQHGGKRLERNGRGVALIMQSSNMAINATMQARGLPISYMVTVGNQAQISLAEVASGLLDDDGVSCLGLHIEGIGDIRAFEALAAKSRRLGKPIVAIKVGRSPQAQAAALSHTASLAGADAAADALLARLGIARVHSLPTLLESLKLLHVHGALSSFDVTSLSCSGGEASMVADAALATRLRFSPFDQELQGRVKATLGPLVTVANPLDYHTFIWNDEAAMTETFAAVLTGNFALGCLILDYPRIDRCDPADWQTTERAFAAALARTGAKGAIVTSLPENMPEERAATLIVQGIAPLAGIDEAMAAAEAAAVIGAAWRRTPAVPLALPRHGGCKRTNILDEAEGKRLLSLAGLTIPDGRRVIDAQEAAAAADALGYPVALKVLGIAHKTEAGAVRLGLDSHQAVLEAAFQLAGLGHGLLVERMVEGTVAELIIGVTRDPVVGLLLTIGSGGILVELLDDAVSLLLPATDADLRSALDTLKCAPLLAGYRGRPAADYEAAVAAIRAIADFAVAHVATLVELDVNPLIVGRSGQGAYAADVLLHMEDSDD